VVPAVGLVHPVGAAAHHRHQLHLPVHAAGGQLDVVEGTRQRMAAMKALARLRGTDHDLAVALWDTGWYEARTVAALVADPALVTADQMDAWAGDFDNSAIVDTVCFNLFDRTPHAWAKVDQWAARDEEFVQRAALALLWALALHDGDAAVERFRDRLAVVERAAHDERHLVHKAAAMALRAIAKRRAALVLDVRALAERLDSDGPPARAVGRRTLRET
jgi:3-methyladenine DNA glycosylase AlkD